MYISRHIENKPKRIIGFCILKTRNFPEATHINFCSAIRSQCTDFPVPFIWKESASFVPDTLVFLTPISEITINHIGLNIDLCGSVVLYVVGHELKLTLWCEAGRITRPSWHARVRRRRGTLTHTWPPWSWRHRRCWCTLARSAFARWSISYFFIESRERGARARPRGAET